ncbi:MAG: DUF421 domain-containing protein [Bacilli bacterium]|nr:DUF421 domain-containing protein [Bacilli bacterium]
MEWMLLLKISVIYFFILFLLKFMGKREIGQLSLFDFVVVLLIADIAVIGVETGDVPFYMTLLSIFLIGIIQKLLAVIMLKIKFIRDFFDGKESIIMIDGKLNIKEMKKQSYNVDDLVVQMRIKNIRSLSEVRYAVLESNGEISIFKFKDFPSDEVKSKTGTAHNPAAKTDGGYDIAATPAEIYPFPLIVSGKVHKGNLKLLGLSEDWLRKEFRKKGYQSEKEIYYANYENKKLFIIETCDF